MSPITWHFLAVEGWQGGMRVGRCFWNKLCSFKQRFCLWKKPGFRLCPYITISLVVGGLCYNAASCLCRGDHSMCESITQMWDDVRAKSYNKVRTKYVPQETQMREHYTCIHLWPRPVSDSKVQEEKGFYVNTLHDLPLACRPWFTNSLLNRDEACSIFFFFVDCRLKRIAIIRSYCYPAILLLRKTSL